MSPSKPLLYSTQLPILRTILTKDEQELVKSLSRVLDLEHIVGEFAEKEIYQFLKDCIEDEEVVVINNLKIMTLRDLDELATDFEKDFVILNLTKRFIMSLEVKSNCNEGSLKSALSQTNGCKELIDKWCGSELTEENGWSFYSTIYFQQKCEEFSFCEDCARYIFFGEEFKEKFTQITKTIPRPPSCTDEKAREEFKWIVKCLLFLASYELIVTPAMITGEVDIMIEKASDFDNIIFWNQLLCWTPRQLSLLKDEGLIRLIFLSPPSCGKTVIITTKAKNLARKGQKVLILLPCFRKLHTLLFLHLKQEFEGHYENRVRENIKVDNVKVDEMFSLDAKDLEAKVKKYKDHHIFIDELAIHDERDIALLKKIDGKCKSLWLAATHVRDFNIEEKLKADLVNFKIVKNELKLPLRNTVSIAKQAYSISQLGKGKCIYYAHFYFRTYSHVHTGWDPLIS